MSAFTVALAEEQTKVKLSKKQNIHIATIVDANDERVHEDVQGSSHQTSWLAVTDLERQFNASRLKFDIKKCKV